MEVGIIGLGKMGENMAVRLLRAGHTVYGTDLSAEMRATAEGHGVRATDAAATMAGFFQTTPRVFWLMVPAGRITDLVVTQVGEILSPGDIVVDGGNTNYKDSLRHAEELKVKGIHFLDCGTSGGVWGLENGYCLMVGGPDEAFKAVEPLLVALAPEKGYAHVGPTGAGHFTKMIHNGIEYGLLEAYAEGFEMLHAAKEFNLDLHQITALWNRGSVIRSWILELAELMYESDQEFSGLEDDVADNGTGRWTVEESLNRAVPLPVISLALQMRFRSRQDQSYAMQSIACMRNQFGGHAIVRKED